MSERQRCEAKIAVSAGEVRRCLHPADVRNNGENLCVQHSPQAKAIRAFVRGQKPKGNS